MPDPVEYMAPKVDLALIRAGYARRAAEKAKATSAPAVPRGRSDLPCDIDSQGHIGFPCDPANTAEHSP